MTKTDQSCGSDLPAGVPDDLRADARRNIRSILEAAARVLAEDPNASMQEIAAAAEVSRPTVYRHFADREELVEAIRLEVMEQAFERLDAAAASPEPAAVALERLIGDLAEIAIRYPVLASMIGSHPQTRRKPPDRSVACFEALIARGRSDGTLRPGLRPEILGPATMGALFLALRAGSGRGADPREVGAEVASLVLGGARSGPAGAAGDG
jgi:TetR/AcrR family transcriptional repressor of mexCD-oprJ operon